MHNWGEEWDSIQSILEKYELHIPVYDRQQIIHFYDHKESHLALENLIGTLHDCQIEMERADLHTLWNLYSRYRSQDERVIEALETLGSRKQSDNSRDA